MKYIVDNNGKDMIVETFTSGDCRDNKCPAYYSSGIVQIGDNVQIKLVDFMTLAEAFKKEYFF